MRLLEDRCSSHLIEVKRASSLKWLLTISSVILSFAISKSESSNAAMRGRPKPLSDYVGTYNVLFICGFNRYVVVIFLVISHQRLGSQS